jgi:peptide/nickel transport system substrate-binding protein
MRLRRRTLLQTALTAPALIVSYTSRAAAPKVIRAVPIGDLKVLDPIWTTAYITRNHAYLVWDTLFALDAQNRPQPQMVETWHASSDGLTYEFTLRPGLLWHDGMPVRAADCVASVRRWGARDGMGRALLAATASIDPLDERSFRLSLKRPVGFVIDALGKIDSNVPFMMPERLANTDPNTQITEALGSGPFRFIKDEWVVGAKVVYERFPGYEPRNEPPSQAAGGKVAKVDRIELQYMPDASVAANALIKGEVDVLESPAPDLIGLLKSSPDVDVRPNDPLGYALFMVLNHLQPPFDNAAARQALAMAVDQSSFMQATVGDRTPWRKCVAMFGCGTAEESAAGGATIGGDLGKARAQFAANYDGRPVVVMDPADNATLHPGALLAADTLRRLGAKVDLQTMDWSTLTQRRASKKPASEGGWNAFVTNATVTGIANPLLNTFARNCGDAWYGWPCDERVAQLTDTWAMETDAAKRHAITEELQRQHLESVTYIPLGQYQSVIAARKSLTGIIGGPALFYWNVDKA